MRIQPVILFCGIESRIFLVKVMLQGKLTGATHGASGKRHDRAENSLPEHLKLYTGLTLGSLTFSRRSESGEKRGRGWADLGVSSLLR